MKKFPHLILNKLLFDIDPYKKNPINLFYPLTDVFELIPEVLKLHFFVSKENNFSGLMEGMDGSVCYLLKTNEIQK